MLRKFIIIFSLSVLLLFILFPLWTGKEEAEDLPPKSAVETPAPLEVQDPSSPGLEAKAEAFEESLPRAREIAGGGSEPARPRKENVFPTSAKEPAMPDWRETLGSRIKKPGESQTGSGEIPRPRVSEAGNTERDRAAGAETPENYFRVAGVYQPRKKDPDKGAELDSPDRKPGGPEGLRKPGKDWETPEADWSAESFFAASGKSRAAERSPGREPLLPGQGSKDPGRPAAGPDGTGTQVAQRQGRGVGVEVRLTSPKIVETEPGRIVTATFQITNKNDREEDFFDHLDLPPDWQMITPLVPFQVKPQGREFKIIAFSVSPSAPGGRYQLTYSVKSQRDYAVTDSDSLSVVVLPKTKIEMLLEDPSQTVIAGDAFALRVRLMNRGNTETRLKLDLKGTPDYPVKAEPSAVVLEAGKSRAVRIEVKSDEKLGRRINHVLTLRAMEGEGEKSRASAVLTVGTEIVPRVSGKADPYHRIQAQLSVIGVAEDGNKGLQTELAGSGSLDEKGEKKIDFLIRTPDTQQKSIFGMRDEYRLSYTDPFFGVSIGDKTYSLSPLTEYYRYGRGAEAVIHPRPLGAGAYYLESRWDQPAVKETGAYLSYHLRDLLQIKGNFLDKTTEKTSVLGEAHDRIYSLQGRVKPHPLLDLGLEYALSESERERDFTDQAYRIDLRGNFADQAWYSFEKTRAGSNFFGYYHDADYTAGAVSFPIYRNLRGNASYRRTEDNLDLDPSKPTATRETSYRGGIAYTAPFGTNFSLEYEDFSRKDRILPADYDFEEKVVTLGVGQAFRKFTLQAYFDFGIRENRKTGSGTEHIERYSLYASFFPTRNQTYSLYARFGQERYSPDLDRSFSIGANASWRINDRFTLSASYQKNITRSPIYQNNLITSEQERELDSLYATAVYTLPNKHSIGFRGRWLKMRDPQEEQTGFMVSYTIPFGIPVSKKTGLGVLKGRVYDAESSNRSFLADVIVTANGTTAVTDRQGEFVFPNLKPGTYFLRVEQNTIGLHRVPTEKLPLRVEVKEGETSSLDIAVVSSAQISGEVAVWTAKKHETEGPERQKGLGEVLVELKNGKEAIRDLTDANGKFSFKGLRPGKWTLKIHANNLPKGHALEKEEFQVELKPGEKQELKGKVSPRSKSIQIIDQGEIRQEMKISHRSF